MRTDCSSSLLFGDTLPSSLERLGEGAFAECGDLETAVVPSGLKATMGNQFKDCLKLREILRY